MSYYPSSIAFALITYYPNWYRGKRKSIKDTDKIRGDIALEFIKEARKRNCHVVVVDGKSSQAFKKSLERVGEVIILKRTSAKRSPNKRLSILRASKIPGVKVIILTEAEKLSLVTDCLERIVEPIIKRNVSIVVPKREEKLFRRTYTSYMYESESEGNKIYNELLRTHGLLKKEEEDLDLFFGPRVFRNRPNITKLFLRKYHLTIGNTSLSKSHFDMEDYSNSIFFPVVDALKKKISVDSVTIPFRYPVLQKENEDKGEREFFIEKRKIQKLSIIAELIHFLEHMKEHRLSN